VRRKREDGRLRDPSGRPAVLEIKGRTGDLKLSDVNQLLQWRDEADGLGKSHKESSGATSNAKPTLVSAKRVFPDNAKSRAQALGLCLITTGQIFAALVALQKRHIRLAGLMGTRSLRAAGLYRCRISTGDVAG